MAILDPVFADQPGATPQDVERRRRLAQQLMQQGSGSAPVAHPLQAVARVLSSGMGALGEYRAGKAEDEGQAFRNNALAGLLTGSATSSGQSAGAMPTSTGPTPSQPSSSTATTAMPSTGAMASAGGGGMDAYRNAIASIESAGSGDYQAVGPTHSKLGRALGRYQVMEANIGPWSREALGREVSPDEFLANPELQDAIFDHRFGTYVDQYGPEGAAQAWFAGPGGVGKMDRQDSLGTSVSAYTDKFSNALGGAGQPTQVASLDSTGASASPGPTAQAMPQTAPQPSQGGGDNAQLAQALTAGAPAPQGNSALNPQVISQLLGNPWTEDIGQNLLGTYLEQSMQGPGYEYITMPDGTLMRTDRNGNMTPMGNFAPDEGPNLQNVGGQLYNSDTGEWITPPQQPAGPEYDWITLPDGTVARTDATSGAFEPVGRFADPTDAPTVQKVTREDGSEVAVQWDGESQNWVPIDAPGGGGSLQVPGDLTEAEQRYTLFQTMQAETQPALLDLERQFNPANIPDAAARSTPIAGNFFQSQEGQIYNASARAWAEGALRIATGAAATPEEMERTLSTYFAQPGDTPVTIQWKAQMREMYNRALDNALSRPTEGSLPLPSEFVNGLENAAPTAQDAAPEQSQPRQITSQEDYEALPSGTVFMAPDGSIRSKP